MSDWKVLVTAVFGLLCLGLGWGTFVTLISLTPGEHKWLWFGGLLSATLATSALFVLFLRAANRTFTKGR